MWIARPSTASAASFTVSLSVGCECTVIPMSSLEPRYSNAEHDLLDQVARVGAHHVAAEQLVGLGVGDDLHSPAVSPMVRARPFAEKGNLPTL
jgi:hypothetical protein